MSRNKICLSAGIWISEHANVLQSRRACLARYFSYQAPQASEGGGAGGGVHTLSSPSPSFADEMSWVPTSPLPEEPVQVQPSQRQRSLPTANYLVGHEVENNEDSDANVNVDAPSGEEQGSGEEKEDGRRGEEETLQGDPGGYRTDLQLACAAVMTSQYRVQF